MATGDTLISYEYLKQMGLRLTNHMDSALVQRVIKEVETRYVERLCSFYNALKSVGESDPAADALALIKEGIGYVVFARLLNETGNATRFGAAVKTSEYSQRMQASELERETAEKLCFGFGLIRKGFGAYINTPDTVGTVKRYPYYSYLRGYFEKDYNEQN